MRYACGVSYLGSDYIGWQRQLNRLDTVQYQIETALSKVANHDVVIFCAGRTDAGVHATGQVIHFDSDAERQIRQWVLGVNSYLPHTIRINWIEPVADDFHARFSARSRSYEYWLDNNSVRSAIWHQQRAWCPHLLNVDLMHQAAQYLLGENDFSAFRAAGCQAHSPIRTLSHINVEQHDQQVICFKLTANAFLYHMVRNIVGSLIEVGRERQSIDEFKAVFDNKDRCEAAATAPAEGLYLVHVGYEQALKRVFR